MYSGRKIGDPRTALTHERSGRAIAGCPRRFRGWEQAPGRGWPRSWSPRVERELAAVPLVGCCDAPGSSARVRSNSPV